MGKFVVFIRRWGSPVASVAVSLSHLTWTWTHSSLFQSSMGSLSPACGSQTHTLTVRLQLQSSSVAPFSPWTLISLTAVHYLSQQEMRSHAVLLSWCVCAPALLKRVDCPQEVRRDNDRYFTWACGDGERLKYVTFAMLKYFFLFHFMCRGYKEAIRNNYKEDSCRMISFRVGLWIWEFIN